MLKVDDNGRSFFEWQNEGWFLGVACYVGFEFFSLLLS